MLPQSGVRFESETPRLKSSGVRFESETPRLKCSAVRFESETPRLKSSGVRFESEPPRLKSSGVRFEPETPRLKCSAIRVESKTLRLKCPWAIIFNIAFVFFCILCARFVLTVYASIFLFYFFFWLKNLTFVQVITILPVGPRAELWHYGRNSVDL